MLRAKLADVAEKSAALSEVRMSTRAVSIGAIREVERQLVAALAGERIRGLPSLTPRGAEAFRAIRIGPKRAHEELPSTRREVLVMTADGRLAAARLNAQGTAAERRPATDEELVAEDLEAFLDALVVALERHLALADARARAYDRIQELAERVSDAVEGWQAEEEGGA